MYSDNCFCLYFVWWLFRTNRLMACITAREKTNEQNRVIWGTNTNFTFYVKIFTFYVYYLYCPCLYFLFDVFHPYLLEERQGKSRQHKAGCGNNSIRKRIRKSCNKEEEDDRKIGEHCDDDFSCPTGFPRLVKLDTLVAFFDGAETFFEMRHEHPITSADIYVFCFRTPLRLW